MICTLTRLASDHGLTSRRARSILGLIRALGGAAIGMRLRSRLRRLASRTDYRRPLKTSSHHSAQQLGFTSSRRVLYKPPCLPFPRQWLLSVTIYCQRRPAGAGASVRGLPTGVHTRLALGRRL